MILRLKTVHALLLENIVKPLMELKSAVLNHWEILKMKSLLSGEAKKTLPLFAHNRPLQQTFASKCMERGIEVLNSMRIFQRVQRMLVAL